VAKFMLDDLENQLKNFIKVFPKDFKKVLAERKANAESRSAESILHGINNLENKI